MWTGCDFMNAMKRVIKELLLTDKSTVNYFSLEKWHIYIAHSFGKPDQPAGHAEPVPVYSKNGKQHVWFISETFQKDECFSMRYSILITSWGLLTCLFWKTYVLFTSVTKEPEWTSICNSYWSASSKLFRALISNPNKGF